ncbi:efflux RND transporter periplasmic adaptor subunit [Ferrimonas gelatinilytica]|uniref:Efflux RND transporter periplasmic adaptor subunit n=1 Tax=Ferrimonas gelatinilytica TaxID=1255257 RepID=A0ABP9SCE2_9GAMM
MRLWIRRLLPLLILVIAVAGFLVLLSTKQAPEKKEQVTSLPIVEVLAVTPQAHQLVLRSYGVVKPKHDSQLVAEISGRLIELTPRFVVGQHVRKGELLARIEPADYQADLMQAQAGLAQAQAQLQEEIARGKVAETEWRGVMEGIPPELGLRKPQLAKEQANVRSAEAALSRAQRNLERTEIRAPFDGIITERNVDLGQYINVSVNLGRVQGTDIAEIRLPLPPEDLAYLNDENSGTVTLIQTQAGQTRQWQAQLVRSEGVINDANRMIYLVAQLDDPYAMESAGVPLKFGSFVNAEIQGRRVDNLLALPRHAVRSQRITVIKADNTVELRPVEVVRADLEQVYVRTELAPGERISPNVLDSLDSGRKVKIAGEEPVDEAEGGQGSASQMAVAGG